MSGHSKWANIKRTKGKTDAARGKVFTKIGREIAVAVKAGGPDPNSNAKLRDVIAKAKAANVPNDNIVRSIKKASGELGNINYTAITYEGYGVGGVAVIVEALTDNKNRTASDIRHIFDKNGGSMGTNGCVSYLFEQKGIIEIEKTPNTDDDEMMMTALDAGAEDFVLEDDVYIITTSAASFSEVRENLEKKNFTFLRSELDMIPSNYIDLNEESIIKFTRMLDMFEDNDDVQNVYHNANLPEEEEEE